MMPGRSKSGLFEAIASKPSTPATPRSSKSGRPSLSKSDVDSNSPLQKGRLSIDRSPTSVESRPSIDYRSPRPSTPDRHSRALKSAELQSQIGVLQEDLKKAKDKLGSVEKEKKYALEDLKEAKRVAEELNEKLAEVLAAQRRAEESLEIEKFRADELEQGGIEAAQKDDEDWQAELEKIHNQHAADVAALLSTTQELQRVKHELAMTTDAKNAALSHADDAMKIAEINAEKVEILSGEVSRLKTLLDSQLEIKSIESADLVQKLDAEVETVKLELEKANKAQEKLTEMETLVEGLRIEVTDAKKSESDACNLLDELKKQVEMLEAKILEANEFEKLSRESHASVTKKLDESNVLLEDAESEIAVLKGKVESLQIEVSRHVADLQESKQHFETSQQEANELRGQVEQLNSEIKTLEEAKVQAQNNEKTAASDIESSVEEKNKLVFELELVKDEGEKVKKAMEGLASALHEVSAEARETQERLLVKQKEAETATAEIKQLKSTLKNNQDHYEVKLEEARNEFASLRDNVEKYSTAADTMRSEWEEKELNFVKTIRNMEENMASIRDEMGEVANLLEGADREAEVAKEDRMQLCSKLREAESIMLLANKAIEAAKGESLQLKDKLMEKENELQGITQQNDDLRLQESAALQTIKELSAQLSEVQSKMSEEIETIEKTKAATSILKDRLLDKENKLQSIAQENDELQIRETAALEKIKELSAQLSEAMAKTIEGTDMPLISDKERETLPTMTEIPVEHESRSTQETLRKESESKTEGQFKDEATVIENGNGNAKGEKELMGAEYKESEREPAESADDAADSKVDNRSLDHVNGLRVQNTENGAVSPINSMQQKKKKPLFHKFGSLLKKKNSHK